MADLKAPLYTSSGAEKGTVDLNPDVFGIEPNKAAMHQVVVAQLAARRFGHGQGQDPRRGTRRGPQAVASEGPRTGTPRIDSLSAVGRRRRRPRSSAARLLATHAEEDEAPGSSQRTVGPGI